MSFNPFATVSDYPTMLNKIAWYTFAVTLVCTIILRNTITQIDAWLSLLTLSIPVMSGLSLPLGTVLPAILLAFLSRATKFHDRISDVLRIRQRFDVNYILLPLALVSGATCNTEKIFIIRRHRETMMYQVFYKYASSGPNKAQIDSHYITMALDQWSWYWIVLETNVWLVLTSLAISIFSNQLVIAFILILVTFAFLALLRVIISLCSDYALQQVEQITLDPARRAEIQKAFNAL